MMMRCAAIPALVIFASIASVHAQTLDSALAFFPMAIGNTWQYGHYIAAVNPANLEGYWTLRVIGDSTMPNGKNYKVFLEGPTVSLALSNPTYLRMDSTTANIYEGNPSVGGGEYVWDSLLARPRDGSRWSNMLYIRSDTILGVPTVTRYIQFYVDGLRRGIAYNLGQFYFEYTDYDEWARIDNLVYAKIDGHEYGTLVSVNPPTQTTPKEFELLQNYPNPFNPSTTIRYVLPSRAHVTLSVFNTLGQAVATLVEEMQNPGSHEARFDGTNSASGVYFYRLQAGTFVQTKRLVILK